MKAAIEVTTRVSHDFLETVAISSIRNFLRLNNEGMLKLHWSHETVHSFFVIGVRFVKIPLQLDVESSCGPFKRIK